MKKFTFIIIAMFAMMISAYAQGQQSGGERSQRPSFEEMQKRQLESMKTELSLTDDQVAKVKVINEEAGKKMQAIFQNRDQNQDREAMRQKFADIRTEQNKKLKEVLTEEQYTKWIKLQEERDERRRENRGQRPNSTGGEPARGQGRGNNF